METPLVWALAAAIAVFAGSAGFFIGRGLILARQKREVAAARDEASQIRKGAETEAENLRKTGSLEGKEEAFRLREEWEKEEDRRREELERAERHMEQRTDALDRQFEQLSEREGTQEARARELEREEKGLEGRTQDVEAAEREAREKLQGLAGISAEEALEFAPKSFPIPKATASPPAAPARKPRLESETLAAGRSPAGSSRSRFQRSTN